MGSSAGGNGTHAFIGLDPGYFAAAITSAANPDKIPDGRRSNLVNFNLWHMVGEADTVQNRYAGSVAFFNEMKSKNAKMKFTLFWKLGHSIGGSMIGSNQIFSTYRNGYKTENAGTSTDPEPNTLNWMFSKSNDKTFTAVQNTKNDTAGMSIYFDNTNDMVHWSSTSNIVKVEVYSLTGTKLMQISQQAINSIDLSSLNNGMYTLRFYPQNQAVFTKKVMKTSR